MQPSRLGSHGRDKFDYLIIKTKGLREYNGLETSRAVAGSERSVRAELQS
jgi:hypothetical protein